MNYISSTKRAKLLMTLPKFLQFSKPNPDFKDLVSAH
jgi:hypothetical protein